MFDKIEKSVFNYHEVFANLLSTAITNKATGKDKPARETLILISEYCFILNNTTTTKKEEQKYIFELKKMNFDELLLETTKQMKRAKLTPQQTFNYNGTYRSRISQYYKKYYGESVWKI